jgi:hypothetical protein
VGDKVVLRSLLYRIREPLSNADNYGALHVLAREFGPILLVLRTHHYLSFTSFTSKNIARVVDSSVGSIPEELE